jgi:hypothetical protein
VHTSRRRPPWPASPGRPASSWPAPCPVTPVPREPPRRAGPPHRSHPRLAGTRRDRRPGAATTQDAELEPLKRRYPQRRIWHGRATGTYWAMPPRDHPTVRQPIGAADLSGLAERIARAERRQGR